MGDVNALRFKTQNRLFQGARPVFCRGENVDGIRRLRFLGVFNANALACPGPNPQNQKGLVKGIPYREGVGVVSYKVVKKCVLECMIVI